MGQLLTQLLHMLSQLDTVRGQSVGQNVMVSLVSIDNTAGVPLTAHKSIPVAYGGQTTGQQAFRYCEGAQRLQLALLWKVRLKVLQSN